MNKWGILGEELLDWQNRFQCCIDGSDSWHDVSAKGHTYYKECPGNPVVNWKEKGYKNLILNLKVLEYVHCYLAVDVMPLEY